MINLCLPACDCRFFDAPTTIEVANIAFGASEHYLGLYIMSELERPGFQFSLSAFAVTARPGDPTCSRIWCLHPERHDDKDLNSKLKDKWATVHLFNGNLTLSDIANTTASRTSWNYIRVLAARSTECPGGIDVHQAFPMQTTLRISTMQLLEDRFQWELGCTKPADDVDITQLSPVSMNAPIPGDYSNVSAFGVAKGRRLMIREMKRLTFQQEQGVSGIVSSKNASESAAIARSGSGDRSHKSTSFGTLLGAALALLTQPRGSLIHRARAPWFWRLVPPYGLLEAAVVVAMACFVLPRARSVPGFCAACLSYRDPHYRRRLNELEQPADAIVRNLAPPRTPRLVSTLTAIPVIFLLAGLSVVEGTSLITAVGFVLMTPHVLLQLLMFMQQPSHRLVGDDDNLHNAEASLVEIRKLADMFSLELLIKHSGDNNNNNNNNNNPGRLASSDKIILLDVLLESVVILCTYWVSLAAGIRGRVERDSSAVSLSGLQLLIFAAVVPRLLLFWMGAYLGLVQVRGRRWYPRLLHVVTDVTHLSVWAVIVLISISSFEEPATVKPEAAEWLPR